MDVTGDDVLLNLATYTSQGDRPIVAWFVLLSFLEYGSYVGDPLNPLLLLLCQALLALMNLNRQCSHHQAGLRFYLFRDALTWERFAVGIHVGLFQSIWNRLYHAHA